MLPTFLLNFDMGGAESSSPPPSGYAPAALPPVKSPGTPCTGGWVGPVAGLDGYREKKISCSRQGSNSEPSST